MILLILMKILNQSTLKLARINCTPTETMGKLDWGVQYVIIFLYVQFWIRLDAVIYRGKEVRTAASPAVRSVNKSRNWVQNEPEYATCVLFTTRLYYKALGIILCHLMANTPQLHSSWRWPLWRYSSPQDVSAELGRCHGDNPCKFRKGVIV